MATFLVLLLVSNFAAFAEFVFSLLVVFHQISLFHLLWICQEWSFPVIYQSITVSCSVPFIDNHCFLSLFLSCTVTTCLHLSQTLIVCQWYVCDLTLLFVTSDCLIDSVCSCLVFLCVYGHDGSYFVILWCLWPICLISHF